MKLILSFLALSAVCAFTSAGLIQPLTTTVELEENSPPNYEFQYSVHDSHTGDIKDQFEHRRGDYVTGRYSLVEPDGNRRIVDYSSDPLLGFSAQVHRDSPSTLLVEHEAAADDAVVATEVVEDSETPAATYRL